MRWLAAQFAHSVRCITHCTPNNTNTKHRSFYCFDSNYLDSVSASFKNRHSTAVLCRIQHNNTVYNKHWTCDTYGHCSRFETVHIAYGTILQFLDTNRKLHVHFVYLLFNYSFLFGYNFISVLTAVITSHCQLSSSERIYNLYFQCKMQKKKQLNNWIEMQKKMAKTINI